MSNLIAEPTILRSMPGFAERLQAQMAYEAAAQHGGERYSETSGNYYHDEVVISWGEPGFPGQRGWSAEDPRRTSNFLKKRIRQLLTSASEPVVVLDVGGEFGTTAHELAAHFAKEIDSSALAIGITNLGPSLNGHEAAMWEDEIEKARQAKEKADGRVEYITTSAQELPDQTIRLKNGTKIGLRGNVNLAHERHAFRYWSLTPGTDIWAASHIIAPDGLYVILGTDCETPYTEGTVDEDQLNQRRLEIDAAHLLIGQLGLQKVSVVEAGQYAGWRLNYVMFRGHDALPVEV